MLLLSAVGVVIRSWLLLLFVSGIFVLVVFAVLCSVVIVNVLRCC